MGKRSKGALWQDAADAGKTYCEYTTVCHQCNTVISKSSTVQDWSVELARAMRDSLHAHKSSVGCEWSREESDCMVIKCKAWLSNDWYVFPDAMPDLLGRWHPSDPAPVVATLGDVFHGMPGFEAPPQDWHGRGPAVREREPLPLPPPARRTARADYPSQDSSGRHEYAAQSSSGRHEHAAQHTSGRRPDYAAQNTSGRPPDYAA